MAISNLFVHDLDPLVDDRAGEAIDCDVHPEVYLTVDIESR